MSGLQRWLNCKYLKIGSGAIVYYHGIHIEYFPSGNKYLFQKGNNVRLNCFQTVTHRDGECPYRSTLWRSYMTTPWLWPLDPSLALHASPSSFFLLVMSHSQGWGRSLTDWADKSEPCGDWANRRNMPASKQNEYTSPTLCLSFFRSPLSLI